MPETNTQHSQPADAGRRKEVVGEVVSNRMKKTIVVRSGAQEVARILWPRGFEGEKVLRAR